jgi:hypothetical protein
MLKLLKALYAALKGFPAAFFKDWLHILRRILRYLCRKLRHCLRMLCRCIKGLGSGAVTNSGSGHIPSHAPAIPINHPAYKRPDPLIYDQYYLMSLGFAVSWQNPDIQIKLGGVPVVSTNDLQSGTTYEVTATIWNGSTSGVISGMPVIFSYLSFGATVQSHYIGTTVIDLGVKGSAHCPAQTTMNWTTPAVPGHYCVQVSFTWIDDANPLNNLGQENTHVVQAASPAVFSFAVGNSSREEKPYRFEFDTYAIPPTPPCSDQAAGTTGENNVRGSGAPDTYIGDRGRKPRVTVPIVPPQHLRSNYPLPEGWTIAFDPPTPVVPGNSEIPVNVTITPPDTFHGSMPLNVHTFSGNNLVGGVTVIVNRA